MLDRNPFPIFDDEPEEAARNPFPVFDSELEPVQHTYLPWEEVAFRFVANLPKSAVQNAVDALMLVRPAGRAAHGRSTAIVGDWTAFPGLQDLAALGGQVGIAGIEKVTGANIMEDKRVLEGLLNFYKENYGLGPEGMAGFEKFLTEDPAGFLTDLMMFASVGTGVTAGVAKAGKATAATTRALRTGQAFKDAVKTGKAAVAYEKYSPFAVKLDRVMNKGFAVPSRLEGLFTRVPIVRKRLKDIDVTFGSRAGETGRGFEMGLAEIADPGAHILRATIGRSAGLLQKTLRRREPTASAAERRGIALPMSGQRISPAAAAAEAIRLKRDDPEMHAQVEAVYEGLDTLAEEIVGRISDASDPDIAADLATKGYEQYVEAFKREMDKLYDSIEELNDLPAVLVHTYEFFQEFAREAAEAEPLTGRLEFSGLLHNIQENVMRFAKQFPAIVRGATGGSPPKPPDTSAGGAAVRRAQRGTRQRMLKGNWGGKYVVEYGVADLDDLIPSHNLDGTPHELFDQSLQPRDREDVSSQMQVADMAKGLDDELLLDDTSSMNDGAPVVEERVVEVDGEQQRKFIVLSGNGRTMAAKLAAQTPAYRARIDKYKRSLIARLEEYGLVDEAERVRNTGTPFLYRKLLSEVDLLDFVKEANDTSGKAFRAAESAAMDARLVDAELLELFSLGDEATLRQALKAGRNTEFINNFIGRFPAEKQSAFYDASGRKISDEGYARIERAMLLTVFDEEFGVVMANRFADISDEGLTNIRKAIYAALPEMAQLKYLIEAGERRADLAFFEDIAQAVLKVQELAEQGNTASFARRQGKLFEGAEWGDTYDDLTDDAARILLMVERGKQAPAELTEFLRWYARQVDAQGSTKQESLFGDDLSQMPVTKAEILQTALGNEFENVPDVSELRAAWREGQGTTKMAALGDAETGLPRRFHKTIEQLYYDFKGDLGRIQKFLEREQRKSVDAGQPEYFVDMFGVLEPESVMVYIRANIQDGTFDSAQAAAGGGKGAGADRRARWLLEWPSRVEALYMDLEGDFARIEKELNEIFRFPGNTPNTFFDAFGMDTPGEVLAYMREKVRQGVFRSQKEFQREKKRAEKRKEQKEKPLKDVHRLRREKLEREAAEAGITVEQASWIRNVFVNTYGGDLEKYEAWVREVQAHDSGGEAFSAGNRDMFGFDTADEVIAYVKSEIKKRRILTKEDIETRIEEARLAIRQRKDLQLKGQRVYSAREFAVLAQAARDPGVEWTHAFYVSKVVDGDGQFWGYEIKGHETTSLGSGMSTMSLPTDELLAEMHRKGAEGILLMHNHPLAVAEFSGEFDKPGTGDRSAFQYRHKELGDAYLGDVVINSGTFAVVVRKEITGKLRMPETGALAKVKDIGHILPGFVEAENVRMTKAELGWDPEWAKDTEPFKFGAEMWHPYLRRKDPLLQSEGPDEGHSDVWGTGADYTPRHTRVIKNILLNLVDFGRRFKVNRNWVVLGMVSAYGRMNGVVHLNMDEFMRLTGEEQITKLREEGVDWGADQMHIFVGKGDWYKSQQGAFDFFKELNEHHLGGGIMSVTVQGRKGGWVNPEKKFHQRAWNPLHGQAVKYHEMKMAAPKGRKGRGLAETRGERLPELLWRTVKRTRTVIGDALFSKDLDPIVSREERFYAQLYDALTADLSEAVARHAPERAGEFEEVSRRYAEGRDKINKGWGLRILRAMQKGEEEKLVKAIFKPSMPLKQIPLVFELMGGVGSEGVRAMQAAFVRELIQKGKTVDGAWSPQSMRRALNAFGDKRLRAFFDGETVSALNDLADISMGMKDLAKMAEGSQTAFLASSMLGESGGLGSALRSLAWTISSGPFGILILLADLFSREAMLSFLSSPEGERFLMEGNIRKFAGEGIQAGTRGAPGALVRGAHRAIEGSRREE